MNIVFVMSDSYRRDNLSCYGPTKVKTPRLDRFAEQAFVFDNAYFGSFPTMPNRLDEMSGRFSCIDHEWCRLPDDTITMQQVLSADGIVTYLVVDNPHMMEMGFNYARGFNAFEWIRGQETDVWKTAPKNVKMPQEGIHKFRNYHTRLRNYLRSTAWWKGEEDHFAPRSIQAACKWLEENQDQDRFFLQIELFDPHEPWDPPQHYVDLYDPGYKGVEVIFPHYNLWREFLTEEELNHCRALYMGEASMVDHWFGVLLDKIDELGLTEDTAVVFVSDHGYLFGEHEIIGKSFLPEDPDGTMWYEAIPLYSEIRRIPLMVRLPEQTRGQHISAMVQTPDLTPTIMEMAGLATTESKSGFSAVQMLQCGMFVNEDWKFDPRQIHGKSLMPLMRGETNRLRDFVVCSHTLVHHSSLLAKCAIVTADGWCLHYAGKYGEEEAGRAGAMYLDKLVNPKLSRAPKEPLLYYLPDDPKEANNVFGKNVPLAREIHQRYVRWLEEVGTPEQHLAGRRNLL